VYLDFFSFSEKPFDVTPDPRFFYLSSQHEEAIEMLLYGVRERKGFMLLTGEVGTGKTTSLREFLNRLDSTMETSLIMNPLLSTLELLKAINRDFGLQIGPDNSVHEQISLLNDFLLASDQKGRNAVVIVDEAQDLAPESLEMVRLLSNLETASHKLIQIILVGQPELLDKLGEDSLRQLRQRIQLRYSLGPLSREETQNYILHRIRKASPKCCLVFQPVAFDQIFQYTSGIPRLVNALCDLVLLAAYARETHVITKKVVDLAFGDLGDKSWAKPWRRRALTRWKVFGGVSCL
jgi:general secretion pathway protein A